MTWCVPFCIYICDIISFASAICFGFDIARKVAVPFQKDHTMYLSTPIELFSDKNISSRSNTTK